METVALALSAQLGFTTNSFSPVIKLATNEAINFGNKATEAGKQVEVSFSKTDVAAKKTSTSIQLLGQRIKELEGKLSRTDGDSKRFGILSAGISKYKDQLDELKKKKEQFITAEQYSEKVLTRTSVAITATVGALTAAMIATAAHRDEQIKSARAAGVSVEVYSSLAYAAKMSGVEGDTLGKVLGKL
ncbi:MAG: hypothetical protein K2X08_05390, partial [Chlamydiales bacterium]|nr:hypothetical protein [Chlamydiales bacterium]